MNTSTVNRIGIDVRLWAEKGLGRYIRGLVRELVHIDTQHTYVLFCLTKDVDEIRDIVPDRWQIVEVNIRWYSWQEQVVLPFVYYSHHVDVLHIPHFNVPLLYRKRFIVTIHDLTHFTHASREASSLSGIMYYIKQHVSRFVIDNALRSAHKVITVSHYVEHQLLATKNVDQSRLSVTYEAPDACLHLNGEYIRSVLEKYQIIKPYFYYIGNAHPHKNLRFLIQNFSYLRKQYPDIQLVMAGDDSYFWPQLREWAFEQQLQGNIVFTGRVSEIEKDALYHNAIALVFPSRSEGFGLPVVEAMQCGCPVIAAHATALPEIGGSAASFFQLDDSTSLQKAMITFLTDSKARDRYISAGKERVNMFSWLKMARQTYQTYIS